MNNPKVESVSRKENFIANTGTIVITVDCNVLQLVSYASNVLLTSSCHSVERVVPRLPLQQLVDHRCPRQEHHHCYRDTDVQRNITVGGYC